MRRSLPLTTALLSCSAVFASPLDCDRLIAPEARLACLERLSEAVNHCSQQQDKLDRLLCFDRLTVTESNHKAHTDLASSDPIQPASPASTPTQPEFGLEHKANEQTQDLMTAQVSAIQTDPYGKWTLTLDNGQRWRQTESKRLRIKVGEPVIIRKGALGSFSLSRADSNSSTKVKRIQ